MQQRQELLIFFLRAKTSEAMVVAPLFIGGPGRSQGVTPSGRDRGRRVRRPGGAGLLLMTSVAFLSLFARVVGGGMPESGLGHGAIPAEGGAWVGGGGRRVSAILRGAGAANDPKALHCHGGPVRHNVVDDVPHHQGAEGRPGGLCFTVDKLARKGEAADMVGISRLFCGGATTIEDRGVGLLSRLRGGGNCIGGVGSVFRHMTLDDRLMAAARLGETNKIRELVEQGGNINCQDDSHQTPLLKASEHGHTAAVEEILKLGGNMNVSDNRDSNALHYAAYNGHTDTVEALVRAGHDLNRLNKFGYSALQYAAADGRQDTVVKLLDLGADVHKTDRLKWTALHRAAGNGHTETVKVLVERGADVNAHDNQFYTALHEATWCGHVETVKQLVKLGADVDKADFWGNTPVDLARSLGADHLSERLLSFLLAHSVTGAGQKQEDQKQESHHGAVGSSGIATVKSRESFFKSTRSASPDDSRVVYYGF